MMENYWAWVTRGGGRCLPGGGRLGAHPGDGAEARRLLDPDRVPLDRQSPAHLTGDLATAVQRLKDRTVGHILLGSPALAAGLDRLSSRTPTNGAVALRYASRR
jgi:hypothetical protein